MRKFIGLLLMLLLVFGITGTVFAQPEETETAVEPFVFDPYNIHGDVLYLTGQNTFASGIGVTIATIYGVAEIRAEGAFVIDPATDEQQTFAGIGIGVDVKKLVEKIDGTWNLPDIIPTVGVLGLINMADKPELEIAVYLSVVELEF